MEASYRQPMDRVLVGLPKSICSIHFVIECQNTKENILLENFVSRYCRHTYVSNSEVAMTLWVKFNGDKITLLLNS